MRQTKKETLIKKIENFANLKYPNYLDSVDEIYDFRKKNSENVKKAIELKQFSGSDLDFFGKFYSTINSSCHCNKGEKLKEIADDVCKAYITLLIQFNKPFDKYLEKFDKGSSFFKKMSALSIIRLYRGSIDEFKFEFKNISNLLYEAIELDPKCYDQCCNIAFEYLDIVLPKHEFPFFKNDGGELTNIQRINFLYKYGESKFIDLLKTHRDFDKWLNICVIIDNRTYTKEGFEKILEEIFSGRKISNEERNKIEEKFSESYFNISTYINSKVEQNQNDWDYIQELLSKYNKKYKGGEKYSIKLGSDMCENIRNINKEIFELEKKYYGEGNHIVPVDTYDLKNIDNFVHYHVSNDGISSFGMGKKTILGYRNYKSEISEELIKKSLNDLKKHTEVTFLPGEEGEITKHMEYEILELPKDLDFLFSIKVGLEVLDSSLTFNTFFDNKEYKHINISKEIINLVRDLNREVSTFPLSDGSSENIIENKNSDYVSLKSENSNWEPNEDKKAISEIDKRVDEYKRTIDEYYRKINELEKQNKIYESLLRENGLSDKNGEKEEDIIEKRKLYRITVIGGSPESIKGFNNLKKNKEFIDKLENHYHLDFKQFDLDGDYKKQQDKKFANKIENDLIFGNTDFIIALQTDHETPLINLIKKLCEDIEYKHRINYFGQLDENGNISKDNQHFSYTKFDKYLEIALNKYETKNNNDLVALS